MAVVLDASVLVVLASGDPRKDIAQTLMHGWIEAGEDLHAPALLPYEVANSLTRLIAAGTFPEERLDEALRAVAALPVTYHSLEENARVVRVALRLGRRSAYDAAYLARGAAGRPALDLRRPALPERNRHRVPRPSRRVTDATDTASTSPASASFGR